MKNQSYFHFLLLFLGTADNQIAAQNTWTQKAGFTSSRHGTVSFGIGTKGYFETDNNSLWGSQDDFWAFDPAINSWTQKANVPGSTRYGAVGFSIDYLGYIGLGSTNREHHISVSHIPAGVYFIHL